MQHYQTTNTDRTNTCSKWKIIVHIYSFRVQASVKKLIGCDPLQPNYFFTATVAVAVLIVRVRHNRKVSVDVLDA